MTVFSCSQPTQAVILAGGLGTRLRPFTETQPKPMYPIEGKAFLERLIEMLRDRGFERILLLLGYLPEKIQAYFGSGKPWGVQIDYSISSVDHETGRRLKLAESKLDDVFLLLYCDNYWPMPFDKMWTRFQNHPNVSAMLTVYRNTDGYTRDNVLCSEEGFIVRYDKSRAQLGLKGVDIGFALIRKSLVRELPHENLSFESYYYPKLASEGLLLAYPTDHRYYSIGSNQRIPITEEFFSQSPTIFLDRDGVLNCKPAKGQYVRAWDDFIWAPGAKQALRILNREGFRTIIITNQAGIARGLMSENDLERIHAAMRAEAEDAGGAIHKIYYCPHHWEEHCDCRKPKPGMFFQAHRDFNLNLRDIYYIGDDECDRQAADAADCRFLQVSESFPLLACVDRVIREMNPSQKASVE